MGGMTTWAALVSLTTDRQSKAASPNRRYAEGQGDAVDNIGDNWHNPLL